MNYLWEDGLRRLREGRWASLRKAVLRRPHLWSFGLVAAACLLCIAFVDRPAALYYKHHIDPEVVAFFEYVTDLGKPTAWFVFLAVMFLVLRVADIASLMTTTADRIVHLRRVCTYVLVSLVSAAVLCNALKVSLGRLRPREFFDNGLYAFAPFDTLWASFPSGHSQAIWSLAICLFVIYPRYDLAYFAVAALIAYSRIAVSVHYVSDVIFGVYIGIVVPLLIKTWFYDAKGLSLRLDRVPSRSADAPSRRTAVRLPSSA